jgi:predicted nucleotidyltransferase
MNKRSSVRLEFRVRPDLSVKILTASSPNSREKVAREAATLLYSGIEKEYKQAKLKAAKTFGLRYLPTNLEVAIELDKIAEENEASTRQDRLVRMRKEALKTMKLLVRYDPVLVGSVWRGTIHRDSDMDIIVHYSDPEDVVKVLEQSGLKILRTQWAAVTKQGKKKGSFHIYLKSPIEEEIEIIVHSPEEACLKEKCGIYGDDVSGLRIQELERALKDSPTQRYVPF